MIKIRPGDVTVRLGAYSRDGAKTLRKPILYFVK